MYCRKCGAEIKETSKFCDNCGCEVVKVKQVNNLIFSKYGFRIKSNVVSMVNVLSVFVTIMGMFALFTY